ncbi:MAG TPA: hypothetical protein VM012_09660 [Flavitalea sp.]|nr:hypothetical protein [Flavitalea sp.]
MTTKKNISRPTGFLLTGLIVLVLSLFSCVYYIEKNADLSRFDSGISVEKNASEPTLFIPGLWQINY